MFNASLERCTEFGVDYLCQTVASISLVSTWTCLTSARALHCCQKNAFNSMCLALRADPLRLIIPSAAEESQHRICCVVSLVSTALHPNFSNQFHYCRRLMPSQAPESAATNSASPLLCAIVVCVLLDAVIGNQPSLPRNHDAVPLTLNRSASPAQSESPHVNTEPTGALFTASRLSVVDRTVMIPGFPRRYRRIDLMFLMSVSLARPVQDLRSLSHRTPQVSSVNAQQFSNKLLVDSLSACRHLLLIFLTAFPSAVSVSF